MRWRVNFSVHLPSDTGGSGDTFTKAIDTSIRPCNADDRDKAIAKARAKLMKYLGKNFAAVYLPRYEITVKSTQKQEF